MRHAEKTTDRDRDRQRQTEKRAQMSPGLLLAAASGVGEVAFCSAAEELGEACDAAGGLAVEDPNNALHLDGTQTGVPICTRSKLES